VFEGSAAMKRRVGDIMCVCDGLMSGDGLLLQRWCCAWVMGCCAGPNHGTGGWDRSENIG